MGNGWQVGIDIGGTFTDIVASHPETGNTRAAKVATRVDDRVAGVLAALGAVSLDWAQVDDLILGTTMVTNAIVENDLAQVALITTRGFGDTLAIGRQNRRHLYRLDLPPKATPQVPPARRFEVTERLDHRGEVLTPLDMGSVMAVLDQVAATGVRAVAVSLLHSYTDPTHEEALATHLRKRFDFVALSSQVNPEAREYERTATTVLSASVMPLAAGHLDRLDAIKPAHSRLHLFHSAGGMAAPSVLRDLPLGLAMSGPAAGVAAAGHVADALGIDQALSFDMGGTTTDVCLIRDGQAAVTSNRTLGDRPMRQPMVAVDSIGAGGGSIARLDHGALVVGPQSAGADPGPACYGKGGTQATVSDANVVLGYLDAGRALGGDLRLDANAARRAIAPLAANMDMTVEQAALGIVRVANAAMTRALGRITVEQGIDGRACTLLAFGGAGPMHAVDVAKEFGISRVIIPRFSSMFSALGCVSAQMRYTRQQTLRMASTDWDARRLNNVRDALRTRLGEHLAEPLKARDQSTSTITIDEVALIRYRGQSYAIEVPDPDFEDRTALGAAFQALHNKLYGFATDEPWELESLRMVASLPKPPETTGTFATQPSERTGGQTTPCPIKSTPCWFAQANASQANASQTGPLDTPRHDRASLPVGQPLPGPLVVEDAFSTIIVPPGATLTPDRNGHLLIDTGLIDTGTTT